MASLHTIEQNLSRNAILASAGSTLRRIRTMLNPAAEAAPKWELHSGQTRPQSIHPDTAVRLLIASGNDYHGDEIRGRAGDLDWSRAYAWIRMPTEAVA